MLQLYLWHEFENRVRKIKQKLRIACGSVPSLVQWKIPGARLFNCVTLREPTGKFPVNNSKLRVFIVSSQYYVDPAVTRKWRSK
jgi:hypothetical protein